MWRWILTNHALVDGGARQQGQCELQDGGRRAPRLRDVEPHQEWMEEWMEEWRLKQSLQSSWSCAELANHGEGGEGGHSGVRGLGGLSQV